MNKNEQNSTLSTDYVTFLGDIKIRIRQAQVRASLAVNSELVLLYWSIGRDILIKQKEQGWGTKVIERLSKDLYSEFPDQQGYSSRNLKYMRAFAEAWSDGQIVQEVLAQITWYHNIALLEKIKDSSERLWYIRKTIENGWSRNVLVHQIESGLFERQGKAQTNFEKVLPAPQSDLAHELLKDPYNFDFLTLGDNAQEKELHKGLLDHIRAFLLELGTGFSFVGSEYHLEVGQSDFYIDLLFYHLKLRCYIVIELKTGKFQPEYAGKMNFYLSAIDDLLRHPEDKPSIGLVLCKDRDNVVAEYALRDVMKPIGVAGFEVTRSLPTILKDCLPSIEEIEKGIGQNKIF